MNPLSLLLDLLYPPRCVFCHDFLDPGEGAVCAPCRRAGKLPRPDGPGERHGDFFRVAVFALYYEGQVRESLLRYKFGRLSGYAETYGVILAETVREGLDGDFDLITWVPVSGKRRRERGYDQAELLARALGRGLGCPVAAALKKRRNTPKQSQTGSREKRRANVSGVFAVTAPEAVEGKRVLLVDDIVTTGATFSECARMLRSAGAAEVCCAALAGVREPEDP